MSFVNLEAGSRTYIASLRVNPNFAPALDAGTRADRKSMAYDAMVDAEVAVKTTLLPKLDALKAEGLVRSYDFATGTGALITGPCGLDTAPAQRLASSTLMYSSRAGRPGVGTLPGGGLFLCGTLYSATVRGIARSSWARPGPGPPRRASG